jgi:mono/diheme cytochrome c family protein
MGSLSFILGAALALCGASASASAAGDARTGQHMAERWCTGCHVVDRQTQGADTAPSFQAIAARNAQHPERLRTFLAAPHPPMSGFNLSREQIDDIVAYLVSLSPRQAPEKP